MKKMILILLISLILVGTIIAVGETANVLIYKDRDVSVSLDSAQQNSMSQKTGKILSGGKIPVGGISTGLTLGNVTCIKVFCQFPIYDENNKIYTWARFQLQGDISTYSESDFMDLRDSAVQPAIDYEIDRDNSNDKTQVNVKGDVNLK
jgi:hypothetical protein